MAERGPLLDPSISAEDSMLFWEKYFIFIIIIIFYLPSLQETAHPIIALQFCDDDPDHQAFFSNFQQSSIFLNPQVCQKIYFKRKYNFGYRQCILCPAQSAAIPPPPPCSPLLTTTPRAKPLLPPSPCLLVLVQVCSRFEKFVFSNSKFEYFRNLRQSN